MIPIVDYVVTSNIGCTEGEIRLQGGVNYTEGRVEICHNNEWGTVCNRAWNVSAATVICRQLGLAIGLYKD